MKTKLAVTCARRKDTVLSAWVRSLTAQPTWMVATAHGMTLEQAARVQAVVADLAEATR